MNSSVILPPGPPAGLDGGAEGAGVAAAAAVAYSAARERRNPVGEGRDTGEWEGHLGPLKGDLEESGRREEERRREERARRVAMAGEIAAALGFCEERPRRRGVKKREKEK